MSKQKSKTGNPFLVPFGTKDEAIPFDRIKPKHFRPALEEALRQAKANIKAINDNHQLDAGGFYHAGYAGWSYSGN